jgi:hypothetical protein
MPAQATGRAGTLPGTLVAMGEGTDRVTTDEED